MDSIPICGTNENKEKEIRKFKLFNLFLQEINTQIYFLKIFCSMNIFEEMKILHSSASHSIVWWTAKQ